MPRLSAMIWSHTAASSGPRTLSSSSARASASPSPWTDSSGSPARTPSPTPVRAAHTIAIRSARSRRATKPRICSGGVVEPLRVVDDADQRLLLGDLGQQRQRGEPDQEPVGRRAGAPAEHGRERVALRGGEPVEVIEHRGAELVEAAVGQLDLRLDARPPSQRASRRRGRTGSPAARSCPRPPPRAATMTRLRPASASARSRSSASHSARRPRSRGAPVPVSAAIPTPNVSPRWAGYQRPGSR